MLVRLRFTAVVLLLAALAQVAPAADAPKLAIGYCTADVESAKAAGFDFAEVRIREFVKLSDEDFAAFLKRYQTVGLPTPAGHWFLPAELKVVGPDVDMERVMSYMQKTFERCEKLGVKIIVFGSGDARRAPDGFPKEQAIQQLVTLAKRIAPEAQKHGMVIVAEPLRKAEANTINTTAEALQWVEAVNHPNFQLMVDLYHLAEEGEDPEIIVKASAHMKHAHISNPRGRVVPLRADEYDYSGFLKALRRINYTGLLAMEASSKDLAKEGPKSVAFVRAAYASTVP